LALLDDKQVRQVLALKLKAEAVRSSIAEIRDKGKRDRGKLWNFLDRTKDRASDLKKRLDLTVSNIFSGSDEWAQAFGNLSGGKGPGRLLLTLLMGGILILIGIFAEGFLQRSTERLRKQLSMDFSTSVMQKIGRLFSRLLLDAFGICVYVLTTIVLFVLIFDKGEPGYGIAAMLLLVSYYLRIVLWAAQVIFSPASSELRLIPMQDMDAKFLYRWVLRVAYAAAFWAWASAVLLDIGESEAIATFFHSLAGFSIIVLLIAMVWQARKRVAEAICPAEEAADRPALSLRVRFAGSWHYVAILFLIAIGILWVIQVLLGGEGRIIKLIVSLFLVPIFIGLDQWGRRLMKMASGELRQVVDFSKEDAPEAPEERALQHALEDKKNIRYYIPLIQRAFRIVLVLVLCFTALKLWGIDLSFGRIMTARALNILITLVLGFVLWEILKTRIDQKIKEELPDLDEGADPEEGGGGAGGSRNVTLLLLLKKFVLSVILVIIPLIVLSAIGINIGPLLAGAGVMGLAIGFGAQTLVRDIISGVFFLIDDAFRVGDYIEAGKGTKGKVEHISLRSLRVRSPNGMIYTIPFGSLGTVTNFSRDYIVTKLNFRVRYDTNIDKVRKIIKNINNELAADEEVAPFLLEKLKSQGIRELDDSAMVMRVKFKTIPGKQFVVRRKVFQRMQELFQKNGIEFAHRNVTVYMPQETGKSPSTEQEEGQTAKSLGPIYHPSLSAGAAAALALIQAEEEQKAKQESSES